MNLGEAEYLVGASPEMYVRVDGDRVETCPISGTIARGRDAIGDAAQILALLASGKDESELTMCTDVDRNDKSRICVPGSVRVIGRRQIEMYSRLIHTVDHVEGRLRPGFDALDAFLAHAWAVTVTGAPKAWAMQFIEDHERSPRAWYGGAVGLLGFDGNLNTGLTLRTIRVKDGVAEVRAGATLLYDSDPEAEEAETELKASAFLDAIRRGPGAPATSGGRGAAHGRGPPRPPGRPPGLVRAHAGQLPAADRRRRGDAAQRLPRRRLRRREAPPGRALAGPGDAARLRRVRDAGGAGAPAYPRLRRVPRPAGHGRVPGRDARRARPAVHGKASRIRVLGGQLFEGLPAEFTAGRYHSLFALRDRLPAELEVTAESEDGVVMAVEHRTLPLAAVQFHPESIMTLGEDVGLRLLANVMRLLAAAP